MLCTHDVHAALWPDADAPLHDPLPPLLLLEQAKAAAAAAIAAAAIRITPLFISRTSRKKPRRLGEGNMQAFTDPGAWTLSSTGLPVAVRHR